MPKALIYITAKVIWQFLFYSGDSNENRPHVHIGKRGMKNLCKIWLEPEISVAKEGDLTQAQIKEVLKITEEQKTMLLEQWNKYKVGQMNVKRIKK